MINIKPPMESENLDNSCSNLSFLLKSKGNIKKNITKNRVPINFR